MKYRSKIIRFGSKKNPSKKSKISQDQLDWLMMELETMRETNETLRNRQRSEARPAEHN